MCLPMDGRNRRGVLSDDHRPREPRAPRVVCPFEADGAEVLYMWRTVFQDGRAAAAPEEVFIEPASIKSFDSRRRHRRTLTD